MFSCYYFHHCYKIITSISNLIDQHVFVQYSDDFISRKLDEVLSLMVEVLPSCHFAAKRHRLDCLYFVIVHISKVIAKFIIFQRQWPILCIR